MTTAPHSNVSAVWIVPVIKSIQGQSPALTDDECTALRTLVRDWQVRRNDRGPLDVSYQRRLQRLLEPIEEINLLPTWGSWSLYTGSVRNIILRNTHRHRAPMWAWTRDQWITAAYNAKTRRHMVAVLAYLVADIRDLHVSFALPHRRLLAQHLFGRENTDISIQRVRGLLRTWGAPCKDTNPALLLLCDSMLERGSPRLEDLSDELLQMCSGRAQGAARGMRNLQRALIALGVLRPESRLTGDEWLVKRSASTADVALEWRTNIDRWFRTSTLSKKSRQGTYSCLVKAGRWLASVHPAETIPAEWTREIAAEWVAAVDRMVVGDYAAAPDTDSYRSRLGQPLKPRSKNQHIGAVRRFFLDCHHWGWFTLRFDPTRALTTPRSIRCLIGTDPNVIADDVWAKLMWAGLNLTADDLPNHGGRGTTRQSFYPLELTRAQ